MRVSRLTKRIVLAVIGIALVYAAWIGISLSLLPPVASLAKPRVSLVITVKDWNRKDHPFVLGPRNPFWTPISAIPSCLKKAVVAAEDAKFYVHDGVDYDAIKDAIRTDLRRGKFVRGGSTITQQVAKNVFLSREKTISRKIKEILLARRMDDTLSKSRILELYLNSVELGPMVYGVGHASTYYFGKHPSALTIRESAFLASMLPGPRIYDPYRRLDRVVRRSDRILKRMFAARMISGEEYRGALSESPNVARLEKKVEKTMAAPPQEEPPPVPLPAVGPGVIEAQHGKEIGAETTEPQEMPPLPETEEAPFPPENAAPAGPTN